MNITWPFDPTVYAGLIGLLLGYGWLARERLDNERRPLFFLSGVALLWIGLETPIDTIGEYLSSVHMIQHMLLGMVAPPLLLLGLSPEMARLLVRSIPGLSWMTRPVQAQTIAAAAWIAWHLPWMYNLTTSSLQVHVIEHVMFILTGLVLFWPTLEATASTLPEKMSDPWRMIYLGVATLPQDAIALPLQFSNTVFYAAYRTIPNVAVGYSPVVDQTVAGAIMMVTSNFVMAAMLLSIFFRWLRRDEARQQQEDLATEQENDPNLQAWLRRTQR